MRWLVFTVQAHRIAPADSPLAGAVSLASWSDPAVVEADTWLEAVESLAESLDGHATAIPLEAVEGFAHISRAWMIASDKVTDAASKATSEGGDMNAHEVQSRLRELLEGETERRTIVAPVEKSVDEMLGLTEPLLSNHHAEGAMRPGYDPKPFGLRPDVDSDRQGL